VGAALPSRPHLESAGVRVAASGSALYRALEVTRAVANDLSDGVAGTTGMTQFRQAATTASAPRLLISRLAE
jgi:hypothetical protein